MTPDQKSEIDHDLHFEVHSRDREIYILELALKVMYINLNDLITECIDEDGKPKKPSRGDLMRARACLPPQYSQTLQKG